MKRLLPTLLIVTISLSLFAQNTDQDSISVFHFYLEFELTNDQGDCDTGEYLKKYGTKGKTRALEYMYPVLDTFYTKHLRDMEWPVRDFPQMAPLKMNPYGYPLSSLNKAVKSGQSERYMKISLKDVGQVIPGQMGTTNGQAVKPVVIKCHIQLYDGEKNLLKEAEGQFKTGEKVSSQYALGVDLRKYQGSGWDQELKFYEVCFKMAFLRALEKL